jgi:hypothetical protein
MDSQEFDRNLYLHKKRERITSLVTEPKRERGKEGAGAAYQRGKKALAGAQPHWSTATDERERWRPPERHQRADKLRAELRRSAWPWARAGEKIF